MKTPKIVVAEAGEFSVHGEVEHHFSREGKRCVCIAVDCCFLYGESLKSDGTRLCELRR